MGRKFVYDGVLDTMTGHARRRGIPLCTIEMRVYRYGNRPETRDLILYKGNLRYRLCPVTIADRARRLGLDPNTVYQRLHRGATVSQALARGRWRGSGKAVRQPAHGNHTRRKLAALGIFA